MSEFDSFIQSIKPDVKSVFYAGASFVATLIWGAIRARRIALAWTATFQPFKPSAQPISSKVSVLVNNQPALNLHSCFIVLTNESARDIEKLDLLIQFQTPFVIVDGGGGIETSSKALLYSADFYATLQAVAALPEVSRPAHESYDYLTRSREFHVPALNRGEKINLLFWINSASATAVPFVVVSTEKAGVRMVSRKADIRPLNMAQLRAGLYLGIPLALLYAYIMSRAELTQLQLAFLCVFGGLLAGAVGIALQAFIHWLRRIV
jgi:hypothetical protein